MTLLPPFTSDGLLPPGDYPMTFQELRISMLVVGPLPAIEGWDAPWRAQLVENLAVLAGQLEEVGIPEVFIDGSFVEDKVHPNDIDGYFCCDLAHLASGSSYPCGTGIVSSSTHTMARVLGFETRSATNSNSRRRFGGLGVTMHRVASSNSEGGHDSH